MDSWPTLCLNVVGRLMKVTLPQVGLHTVTLCASSCPHILILSRLGIGSDEMDMSSVNQASWITREVRERLQTKQWNEIYMSDRGLAYMLHIGSRAKCAYMQSWSFVHFSRLGLIRSEPVHNICTLHDKLLSNWKLVLCCAPVMRIIIIMHVKLCLMPYITRVLERSAAELL